MVIELMYTADDVSVVHKKICGNIQKVNAELVRYDKERDIMSVSITDIVDLDFNYAKVNGKYYYCTPIVNEYGFSTLELTIDFLKTYATEIGNCIAELNRANNNANYYINDGFFKTDSFSNVEYIQGWNSLGNASAYLVTTGASL